MLVDVTFAEWKIKMADEGIADSPERFPRGLIWCRRSSTSGVTALSA
jgi:hypothetical protein